MLFETKPDMLANSVAVKEWQKLGPFDYARAITEHKLTFDVNAPFVSGLRFQRGTYFGQQPTQPDSYAIGRKVYKT